MPFLRQQPESDSEKEASTLLRSWDDSMSEGEEENDEIRNSEIKKISIRNRSPSTARYLLPVVTTLTLVIFALGFSVSVRSHLFKGPKDTSGLSKYFHLAEYSTTWLLEGDQKSGEGTLEAAKLWEQILETDGIVSIPHTWAQQHDLSPSDPHPEQPDHGVYQIDLWHSLHCLFRIRNRITSHVPIDEHPRDDAHTLHCLDYLRQQLMCHADTTLQEGLSNRKVASKCKDFGAIQRWVRDHGWPGYRAYMAPIMAAEEEAVLRAARNRSVAVRDW